MAKPYDESTIPGRNLLVDCSQPHGELLDMETGTVWQTHGPVRAVE